MITLMWSRVHTQQEDTIGQSDWVVRYENGRLAWPYRYADWATDYLIPSVIAKRRETSKE